MPNETLLTADEAGEILLCGNGWNAITSAQHVKTLAWADARKVKCPCRRTPDNKWSDLAWSSCPICGGWGVVTLGELVKKVGV